MNTKEVVDDTDENDKPPKKAKYSSEVSKEASCSCTSNQPSPINLLMSAADRALDVDIPTETFSNPIETSQTATSSREELNDFDTEDEDYYLLRWQAKQLAKGFMDNTINRVLEEWRLSGGVTQLAVSCDTDDDELVEDEGILMAIQSHGLRQEMDQRDSIDVGASLLDNVENGVNKSNIEENGKIDDTDFLNAAVSVAICSKGLSSCSYK